MVFSLITIFTFIGSSSTRWGFGDKSGKLWGIKKTTLKAIAERYILGIEIPDRMDDYTSYKTQVNNHIK